MPLYLSNTVLHTMNVDAVVNPTDCGLSLAVVHQQENAQLQQKCDELQPVRAGEVRITSSCGLPARNIAHLVLPESLDSLYRLRRLYAELFSASRRYGWRSIAIPLVLPEKYSDYSVQSLYGIIIELYTRFSEKYSLTVYLVIQEKSPHLDEGLLLRLQNYIHAHLHQRKPIIDSASYDNRPMPAAFSELSDSDFCLPIEKVTARSNAQIKLYSSALDDDDACMELTSITPPRTEVPPDPYCDPRSDADMDAIYYEREKAAKKISSPPLQPGLDIELDESFAEAVLRLEHEKGLSDPQLYTRANLSRAVFNKLKQSALNPYRAVYQPSKTTALALCIGLRLGTEEAAELLKKAGYAISHSSKGDLIVEYFLSQGRYDIFEINEVLFRFDQVPLGSF